VAELDPPEASWRRIELVRLSRFLSNPAAFLLNQRLDLYLEAADQKLPDTEPFRVDRRDRYRLDSRFVDKELAGDDPVELERAVRASGMLPHGAPGETVCGRMRREAARFAEKTRTILRGERREPLDIDLASGLFRVVGRIDSIYPDDLVRFRPAPLGVRDRLELWLRHVLLNCIEGSHPRSSLLIGRDPENRSDPGWAAWKFSPLADAPDILEKIVSIYWEGLRSPLPFFPKASWEFALQILDKKKPREEAIGRARNLWLGSEWARGERDDPYFRKCFETGDPFDSRFEEIALALLGPIIRHQKKIESIAC
jgi:exodeoxyribonuclease V gamma subunit